MNTGRIIDIGPIPVATRTDAHGMAYYAAKPATTIYLSGPMTGKPDFNAAEFARYAERYRAEGFVVISPPEMDDGDTSKPYEFYIRRDIRVFLEDRVDRLYLLPGWQGSKGANLEKHLAEILRIPVYDAETGEPYRETVAQEAYRLVHGDRGADYSHPLDDFGRTARMVNALLQHKLSQPVSEEDIALIMIAVKLSRLANKPDHRDSAVDIAGYAECYFMVREERERRKDVGQAS